MVSSQQSSPLQYSLIVFFIYLSVFVNSYVFFQQPFEFYLGYVIYIVLLPVFIKRYGINKHLAGIFFILLVTGLFNIFIGNDTTFLFFKVFFGLVLSYLFYDGVIREFNFDFQLLFKWYLIGAYISCVIGLIQFVSFVLGFRPGYDYTFILNKWGVVEGGNFGIRVNSIFAEPTYLGVVISPAFFVAVYNMTRRTPFLISKFRSGVIIATFILSFSGLGQLGIILTAVLLLLNFGFVRYFFIMIILGVVLFNVLYNNVADFRERYDGLVTLFVEGAGAFQLGKTHGSSFILYNNFHVTVENLKTNFLFGSGIGSHPIAFEKYNLAAGIKTIGFSNNSADANSMLLRLMSETGLFGAALFLYMVIKCYVARNEGLDTYHWIISNAILVLIILSLFRQGHYFLNGFPFFLLLYVYNYLSYQEVIEASPDNTGEKEDLLPANG